MISNVNLVSVNAMLSFIYLMYWNKIWFLGGCGKTVKVYLIIHNRKV